MTRRELEELACLKYFVEAVVPVSPGRKENFRILEAAGREDLGRFLRQQHPEAEVVLFNENEEYGAGAFDYIMSAGAVYDRIGPAELFPRWCGMLKDGGVCTGWVPGHAGYYGLVMLAGVVETLAAGKDFAYKRKITRALLEELPANHPAFLREDFIRLLKKGEERAYKELFLLRAEHVFTVSRLLESIPTWGGSFAGWMAPAAYDANAAGKIGDPGIMARLKELPESSRASVSELVTATPPEHFFLVKKS